MIRKTYMIPKKKTPISENLTLLGIFKPRMIQNGMATTKRSVIMVMMAVDMEKVRGLTHFAVGISFRSQAPEIGRHWNKTTKKVATIIAKLKALSPQMAHLM